MNEDGQEPISGPEELGKLIWLYPRTRRPGLLAGAVVELWFPNGEKIETRETMIRVWEDYYRRCADHMSHFQSTETNRLKKIGQDFADVFRRELPLKEGEAFYGDLLGSAASPRGAVYWSIGGLCDDRPGYGDGSELSASFPIEWLLEDPARFVAMVRDWCEMLGVGHGTAGAGVIADQTGMDPKKKGTAAWPLISLLSGVDFPETAAFALNKADGLAEKPGIRGVNWLTILGDRYIEQLGGEEALRQIESCEIVLHPFKGGVIIQAGDLPQVGDLNAGPSPEAYRIVNQAVSPVRFAAYRVPYIKLADNPQSLTPTLQWIGRFD